jgi:hypothetical protein
LKAVVTPRPGCIGVHTPARTRRSASRNANACANALAVQFFFGRWLFSSRRSACKELRVLAVDAPVVVDNSRCAAVRRLSSAAIKINALEIFCCGVIVPSGCEARSTFASAFLERLEHAVPSLDLRVLGIFNLEPAVLRVHADAPLGDDAFQISLADFLKQ